MKNSYSIFLVWMILFPAGFAGVIFLFPDSARLLLNYMAWMIVLLLVIIRRKKAVHLFSGITAETAAKMTDEEKIRCADKTLRLFLVFAALFSLFSLLFRILSLPFYADLILFVIGIVTAAVRDMKN